MTRQYNICLDCESLNIKNKIFYTVTVDYLSPLLMKNSPRKGPFQQSY